MISAHGGNPPCVIQCLSAGLKSGQQRSEEVATLSVERNKSFRGKTTPHQIDVYWKFKKGGIYYEAVLREIPSNKTRAFLAAKTMIPFRARSVLLFESTSLLPEKSALIRSAPPFSR
jgi:hypothetical protein